MDIENNASQDTSGESPANSGIITPDQARQEGYRQDQQVTVNSAGDTKEAGSDTVTTPTGETYTPTPSQNDIDIEEYKAVEHEVETDSVVTPDGKRIYRRGTDSKNTGAAYDLESDQWMETRHSKEAPETDTYVTAEKVDDKTLEARDKATQDLQSGGATWRNDKQQFTKQGEGRLHATGDQMDAAREEMNAALNPGSNTTEVTGPNREAKEREIASNRERNQGMTSTGMSEGQRKFFQEQQAIADKAKEQARWRQAKDKEVARNRELNENVSPVGMSKGMRKFFSEQDEIARRAREQNVVPQETTGGEGTEKPEVNPLEAIDQRLAGIDSRLADIQSRLDQLIEGQEFSRLSNEQLLEYIKLSTAETSLRMSKLEALLEKQTIQTNTMINNIQNNLNINIPGQGQPEVTTTTTPQEEEPDSTVAPEEGGDGQGEEPEVTTPPQTGVAEDPGQESTDGTSEEETDPLAAVNERITDIDQRLEGLQGQLDQLLEGQDLENLGREQLLEYIRLSTLQSNLQMSRFEALMERQAIQTTNTINNLTNNINIGGAGTPETPGEEDGEDGSDDGGDGDGTEPTPPEEVSQSDRITQLENQLAQNQQQFSEFIGENTPEQRSLALTQQLAELEDRERTQGLTDAEKVQWFDLNRQKEAIDSQINQEQQESRRKRERKEKIIKIVAGVAGGAIALASPPVGIAALVGVTLGGRLVGKGLKKWSENLRSKSNAMKYESRRGKTPLELGELDKKIRRRARWADRLGEISAVTLGGSAGYGLGKAVQNIFGWKGIGGGNTPPEGGTAGGNEGGDPTGEGAGGEGGGNTPPDLNTTPEGDIGGPADSFELPDAPTTNFDSLPDKLSFQDYPEMAKGLVQRGMSADRAGGGLLIRGAEGGWANAQGNVVEKMLEMGYDINTPEAGWAIGDLSANRAPLNEQTINSAINAAKQVLGGN